MPSVPWAQLPTCLSRRRALGPGTAGQRCLPRGVLLPAPPCMEPPPHRHGGLSLPCLGRSSHPTAPSLVVLIAPTVCRSTLWGHLGPWGSEGPVTLEALP